MSTPEKLVRDWKLRSVVALATIFFANSSCSKLKHPHLLDVTGCGVIKWGMTLEQAKMVLGPKARTVTDPTSGKTFESVTMVIGDNELSGFISTDPDSDRINGTHFVYQDRHPVKQTMFATLKHVLIDDYGAPSAEFPAGAGQSCFWGFASGNILLTSTGPNRDGTRTIGLSYIKNTLKANFQGPHH